MTQLALYKGKGTLANAFIRWWSGSQYSHCELVVGGKWYSSSVMDGGVRCKEIEVHPENWDFVEVSWADEGFILDYFRQTDHMKYGWTGLLLGQFLNRGRGGHNAKFCSEWCAAALRVPASATFNPGVLGEICAYISAKMNL